MTSPVELSTGIMNVRAASVNVKFTAAASYFAKPRFGKLEKVANARRPIAIKHPSPRLPFPACP